MIWKDNIMKYDYKASAANQNPKKKTVVSPFFLAFYGFFVFSCRPFPTSLLYSIDDISMCTRYSWWRIELS